MIDPAAPRCSWKPIVWYGGFHPGLPNFCVGHRPQVSPSQHPGSYRPSKLQRNAKHSLQPWPGPCRSGMAPVISPPGPTPR